MKKLIILGCIGIALLTTACNKNTDATASTDETAQLDAVQAVAVARGSTTSSNSASTSRGDSIYAVNTCERNQRKTRIDFTTLSTTITTYLDANYAGYSAKGAVQITDANGTVIGYIAIITLNNNPVAIKFDANGNFIRVLELRQGIDIFNNRKFHPGGCFDGRDGKNRDTIAIANLPVAITAYITTTFTTDTIVKAFATRDSNIVVITKTPNGLYANVFDKNNVLIKRVQMHHCGCFGKVVPIAETDLPVSASNYLTATYAGYTLKQAFKIVDNTGTIKRYVVLIDANNSKYVVEFDASGNFLEAHLVH